MLPESNSDLPDPHATVAPLVTDPFDTVPGGPSSPATSLDRTVPYSATAAATQRLRIGRYEILSEIARGGMGVVYKAFDPQLDRTVALKLIKSGELADEDDIERFQTEAKAAAQLDHPGIVQVYEVGEFGGQHYMAMAFIDGHSLWQEVKESPLAPKHAAKLMQQVAEAIHFAHDRGIVHRDLKPQNILLTKDRQPKVTDFGLAKRREYDGSLTQTGQALGTPSYMPPEQAKGQVNDIGPLADVYSLGATLYCLLTGRPPFQAATQLETMLQVVEQEPVSPKSLNRAVSVDLETICLKTLEKEPGKRYASAAVLADDLRRFQSGEPILARPISFGERGWRWCRRNPVVAGLTTATLLLLISVITVYIASSQREVRSLAISAYLNSLDNGLQRSDWTTDHVRELDEVLDKLTRLDSAKAETSRERVNSEFAADLDRRARQPRLSEDDLTRLNPLLELLAARDANLASPIQQLLAMRRSAWQPLVEWQGDSTGWKTAFDARSVHFDNSRLIASPPAAAETTSGDLFTSPRVMTLTESGPNVQCEVQFESPDEDVVDLGLELNTLGTSSYGFRVQRTAERRSAADELGSSRFEQPALMQICRDGRVLRQTEIDGAKLIGQPVRLRAKRQGTLLSLQLNDAASIELDDPFPLPVGQTGHVAVRWPAGSGVTKLVVSQLHRATEASPLETADALHSAGNFQEALQLYRDQAAASGTTEYGREARYKQGVCLLELKKAEDAFALWQQFAAEETDQWTTLAEIQLWALLLERSDIDGAEEMLRRLELKLTADELARLMPDHLRGKLIASTKPLIDARAQANMFLLYSPMHVKRLKMARDSIRLLGENPNTNSTLNRALHTGLLFSRDYFSALTLANESMEHNPYSYQMRIQALRHLGDHVGALRDLEAYELQPFSRLPGRSEVDPILLLMKLQVLASLDRWDEFDELAGSVANSVAPQFEAALLRPDIVSSAQWQFESVVSYVRVRAMQGFRLEQLGRMDEAGKVWKDAARGTSGTLDQIVTDFRLRLIVQTMADLDTKPMCERSLFQRDLTDTNPLQKALTQIIPRETLILVLGRMWGTPRGRDSARKSIFESVPFHEDVSLPHRLLGYEYVQQAAFDGKFDDEQDELVWSLSLDVYDAIVREDISSPQLISLALLWKGSTGVFGWNTVLANIPPPLRSKMAYVFAQRYRKLGRPVDAAKLFQSAIEADPDSLAAKLATRDLDAQK